VCLFQSVGNIRRVSQRLRQRQGPRGQPVRQRLAFQVLHYHEIDAILLSDIEKRADRGMVQAANRPGFGFKPRPQILALR
jgi:hypothetical protein